MKVAFCTMEKFDNRVKDSVGSSRIRGNWLIKYWQDAEEYVIGQEYDVMIFQKVYWQSFKNNASDFKGIKILDICDPDWLEGKPVMEYVDFMDATVTSTQALADFIKKVRPNARVLCIPDRMDLEVHKRKQKHEGLLKKLVWFGYSTNVHYIEKTFADVITKGLELTIISDQPYNPGVAYENLKVINVPYAWPSVNKEIIKADTVLMPVSNDDLRGIFKSNNKTLTAWALGMPVIQLPQDLERFKTAEARQAEADKRRKEIEKDWDVKISVKEYQDLLAVISREK
jgi:hypothetical protein